VFQYFKKTI